MNILNSPHSGLAFLFTQHPELRTIISLFGLNFLISALVAAFLAYGLTRRPLQEKNRLFSLLIITGMFIPIFGIILVIVAFSVLRSYIKASHHWVIETFPPLDYTNEKLLKAVAYGAGWARIRLESGSFHKREREQALININKYMGAEVNIINRQLLSDDMDELRLYAFSLIDKQQNNLNKKIFPLLQAYQSPKSPVEAATIEKHLAQLYWEMVYLNLTESELRKLILEKVYFYAHKAVQVLTQDAVLWCLLAHYYQENGQSQESLEALLMASKYHAPLSKVYPYLAESSFYNRNFTEVRKYLDLDISFRDNPTIGKIVEYWCPS